MLPSWLEKTILKTADTYVKVRPRGLPDADKLANAKILSHRGERDDKTVFENTFAAFDPMMDTNVYGFEFDIRWSKDMVPMVFHDPTAERLYGSKTKLIEHTAEEWIALFPNTVTLAQMVERYGKKKALMIELKEEPFLDADKQHEILAATLAGLVPGEDYWIMSFSRPLLEWVKFAPANVTLPIIYTDVSAASDFALSHGCGAIGAHYLVANNKTIAKHRAAGHSIALGFPDNANSLKREIQRGGDFLFSNNAREMQALLDEWRSS